MIGQQTAIGDALGVAVKVLDNGPDKQADKLAILLTDGNDTASQLSPELAAKLAADHHVRVHTIAFGDLSDTSKDKVDLPLLQRIAKTTGGQSWTAAHSGSALDSVWQQIDALTPAQVKSLGWSRIRRSIRGRSPSRCYCYCWPPAAVSSGRKWHERFSLPLSVALNRAAAVSAGGRLRYGASARQR